jgi:hypothetical protein
MKQNERSEKEHKELIVTANNGLKAIGTLKEKYGDLTEAFDSYDDTVYDVEGGAAFNGTEIIREKK